MSKTVIYGNIIDGTGRDLLENGMVVVDGDVLEYVGRREEKYLLPPDAMILHYENAYIMPGLIEAHSHTCGFGSHNPLEWIVMPLPLKIIQSVHDLQALLNAGYTTVRCCGGYGSYHRRAMEKGMFRGPRLYTAMAAISPTAGHADVWTDLTSDMQYELEGIGAHARADGVDECRKMARIQFRNGADFIKIQTTGGIMDTASNPGLSYFTHDEIAAFVEEAERMGTYVATHAESDAGVYNAVMAGVKSIEHGWQTTDRTLEEMIKRGCWQVPTLTTIALQSEDIGNAPPVVAEKVRRLIPKVQESVARARKAGIPMACGADFLSMKGNDEYGGKNCRELLEFTKVGFTPMEAIVCATKNGAMTVQREKDLGTLEAGKIADLIVVTENPLDNIASLMNTVNTKIVMKDGIIEKHIS